MQSAKITYPLLIEQTVNSGNNINSMRTLLFVLIDFSLFVIEFEKWPIIKKGKPNNAESANNGMLILYLSIMYVIITDNISIAIV